MGDAYVAAVVRRYAVGTGGVAVRAAEELLPFIGEWAGKRLWGVELSGSYAKGTATSLGTDVDLFISLAPDETPVKESFWSLVEFCAGRGLGPQVRNVSVRVEVRECKVDLVVGRAVASSQSPVASKSRFLPSVGMTNPRAEGAPHTLYRRRSDTWIKTDVRKHVAVVRAAQCAEEIRALKIWRERWSLEWPSFYLELMVVHALGARSSQPSAVSFQKERGGIASRVRRVLEFVGGGGLEMRVVDPANSNNVVSDELDLDEKRVLVVAARKSWEQVVW
jgi:hypothetical protein